MSGRFWPRCAMSSFRPRRKAKRVPHLLTSKNPVKIKGPFVAEIPRGGRLKGLRIGSAPHNVSAVEHDQKCRCAVAPRFAWTVWGCRMRIGWPRPVPAVERSRAGERREEE